MPKPIIALRCNESEYADFMAIHAHFARSTTAETLRAMIHEIKKTLPQPTATSKREKAAIVLPKATGAVK